MIGGFFVSCRTIPSIAIIYIFWGVGTILALIPTPQKIYQHCKCDAMKLTDTAIRKAKLQAKPYRIADGGGMYIEVKPNGAKYWRMAYRFADKQKTLALDVYPDVT